MSIITDTYGPILAEMMGKSKGPSVITEANVFQKGNKDLLPYIEGIVSNLMEPGSEIRNLQNMKEFSRLAKSGKTCLILAEHYSNFDLPGLLYLLKQAGDEGKAIAEQIVAIAGFKLNEEHPVVLAFTEAYSRIVIYPSRSLESAKAKLQGEELEKEVAKSMLINRAAMKALSEAKERGDIILVYPSGTRYRPWDPNSKKGVREIDSYLKSFDYILLLSCNGNILRPDPNAGMKEDIPTKDKIVFDCSAPIPTEEFRERAKAGLADDVDKKQAIVDAVMAELERMHEAVEATR